MLRGQAGAMSHATGIYALLFSGLSRREGAALGVSVGEQQSHYCDTEQNKTDRAHGSSPSSSFRAANAKAATDPR